MHNPAFMVAVSKDDEHNEFCGGTTFYKTADGTVVFLTEAESYYHRDPAFANYSQLEFECTYNPKTSHHWQKNLTTVKAVNPGPVFNLDQIIHCMHPMWVSFA